jgi:hypothetical protein
VEQAAAPEPVSGWRVPRLAGRLDRSGVGMDDEDGKRDRRAAWHGRPQRADGTASPHVSGTILGLEEHVREQGSHKKYN